MKGTRLWWIGVLLLAAALAYPLMDEVRTYVLTPFFLALRVERLVVQILPEAVWWLLMIFVVIGLGLSQLTKSRQSSQVEKEERREISSRAQSWALTIQGITRSRYSRWLLAHRLSALTLEWIAHQKRIPLSRARQLVWRGELDLPEQYKEYLRAGLEAPELLRRPFFLRFWHKKPEQTAIHIDPRAYIAHLEEKIEDGGSW